MQTLLLYEKRGNLGFLTINRPNELNALSNALVEELDETLQEIEKDEEIRVVVLTGAGDKAFMAGADIKELQDRDFVIAREQTKRRQQVYNRIAEMKIPFIAAINGFALGAGLELALACTLRVACEEAKLGSPEVNLAIIPGDGGTQRLPRMIGFGRAMELVLTGDFIDGTEAYRIGLVNRVVPKEQLLETATQLAEKLAKKAPLAIQCGKEAVNRSMETGIMEGLAHESYLHAYLCASEDKKEGVAAFLEKRKPTFKGK